MGFDPHFAPPLASPDATTSLHYLRRPGGSAQDPPCPLSPSAARPSPRPVPDGGGGSEDGGMWSLVVFAGMPGQMGLEARRVCDAVIPRLAADAPPGGPSSRRTGNQGIREADRGRAGETETPVGRRSGVRPHLRVERRPSPCPPLATDRSKMRTNRRMKRRACETGSRTVECWYSLLHLPEMQRKRLPRLLSERVLAKASAHEHPRPVRR
jgi:hypothetical protein